RSCPRRLGGLRRPPGLPPRAGRLAPPGETGYDSPPHPTREGLMGLFDWFRPAWKSSDVDTRRAAVAALGADELAIITQILRHDPEPSVRKKALEKVDDVDLLA